MTFLSTLKNHVGLAATAALVLFFGITACDVGGPATGDPPTREEANNLTVAERIEEWSTLGYLEEQLRSAGLFEPLKNENNSYTVFATRLDGIDRSALESGQARLSNILQYHVVSGKELKVEDLSDGQTLETMSGEQLTVTTADTSTYVNGALIETEDITASNGFVHIVSRTLLENQSLTSRLDLEAQTGVIDSAIVKQGGIPSGGPYTLFAPINGGFGGLELSTLLNSSNILESLVQYHLVSGETLSGDLSDGQTIQTVDGASLDVTIEGDGTVLINNSEVETADLRTTNGVIHLIDRALLQNQSITDRTALTSNFSNFEAGLKQANLAGTLDGSGPFTVFGPQNGAFGSIDTDTLFSSQSPLQSVLEYHVVQGEYRSGDLSDGQTLTTVDGAELTVSIVDGTPVVNGYAIDEPDLIAGNGVMHGMNDVFLENQTVADRAALTAVSTTFENLLQQAGLYSTFDDPDQTYTVFAPADQAFAALNSNAAQALTAPRSENLLSKILKYHTVSGEAYSSTELASGQRLQTLQGSSVRTAAGSGSFQVNGIPAASPDLRSNNGVAHLIEEDLLLPAFDVVEKAFITGRTLLDKALFEANTRDDVKDANDITVFAPTNAAIENYLQSNYGTTSFSDLSALERDTIRQDLRFHVATEQVTATEFADGDSVETVEGSYINFSVDGNTVTLEGSATVQETDIEGTNGFVHGIDRVLVAPENRQ